MILLQHIQNDCARRLSVQPHHWKVHVWLALAMFMSAVGVQAQDRDNVSGSNRIAGYQAKAAKALDPESVWIGAASDPGEAVKLEAVNQLYDLGTGKALPILRKLAKEKPVLGNPRDGILYPYDKSAKNVIIRIEADLIWDQFLREYPDNNDRVRNAVVLIKEHLDNPKLKRKLQGFLVQVGDQASLEALLDMTLSTEVATGLAKRLLLDRLVLDSMLARLKLLDRTLPASRELIYKRRHAILMALKFFNELADIKMVPHLLAAFNVRSVLDPGYDIASLARQAIAACGPQAIPIVEEFYKKAVSLRARKNAIITIALIGGNDALRFLNDALKIEQERPEKLQLIHTIKAQIERLKNKK